MEDKTMLTREGGSNNIKEIIEEIQSILFDAGEFGEEIDSAYNKSDLAFLKRILKSLGDLEAASNKVIQRFTEIEETLGAYDNKRKESFKKQYRLRRA